MRRLPAIVLAASLAVLCPLGVAGADILTVIPEKSLAAVISRDPAAMERNARRMFEKLTGQPMPEGALLGEVLRHFGLHHSAAARDADGNPRQVPPLTTVDAKTPMALVLVTPAMDIRGMPAGLVFKTLDYARCLKEIATVLSPTDEPLPVEITEDGTDMIKGDKRSVFAAQLGPYTVVADAEYVVKTLKAEAGKPLSAANVAVLRKMYFTHDVVFNVNTDEMVRAFGPQVNTIKQAMQQQMKNQGGGGGGFGGAEQRARMFGAQIDLFLKVLSQTDGGCTGVKLSEGGVNVVTVYRTVPDTTLARLAARVRPVPLGFLDTLGVPAIGAAGWHIAPESLDEMTKIFEKFFVESGMVDDPDNEKSKAFMTSYRKLMEAASGEGAFVWAPPGEGKGLVRLMYLLALKPDVDVRADVREYIEKSMDVANVLQGPLKTESSYEQAVDTHRGCPIDRITITFQKNPDAPEPMNPDMDVLGMVEAIYGPKIVAYLTQARSTLVYSVGYETGDALKAQVDRILDHKRGGLADSEMYREALKGLPAGRSGVVVLSAADMMKLIMTTVIGRAAPEGKNPLEGLTFERASGIGMSFGPAQDGITVYLNVPMQEMQNIKALIKKLGPMGPRPGGRRRRPPGGRRVKEAPAE